jgi:hypothetical protein
MLSEVGGSDDRRGEDVLRGDREAALGQRRGDGGPGVREVVLVSSFTARAACRSQVTASTAPGSGRQDTVSTPSMSIRTAVSSGMPRR